MLLSPIFLRSFLISTFFYCTPLLYVANGQVSSDTFCAELKNMMESAKTGFNSTKGNKVEKTVTGNKKTFYKNKQTLIDSSDCFINDVVEYPECRCILASDKRINESLISQYNKYRNDIKSCLLDNWVFSDKDSTNSFFLEGTKFKKLVGVKKVEEQKLKLELFMYSSMIEKMRVVELKIEGIAVE